MIFFPAAKINIGLNILRKRPDGYHDIETLFYPISLFDALEWSSSSAQASPVNDMVNPKADFIPVLDKSNDHQNANKQEISIQTYSKSQDSDNKILRRTDLESDSNLVLRAYNLLKKDFDLPTLTFTLLKNIPIGAGLGGGSSDAAYTLVNLNKHFKLGLGPSDLTRYASKLGSDCAFFIDPKPSLASQRGEVLRPFHLDLNAYSIVIIKPELSISTAEAYSRVKPKDPDFDLAKSLKEPIENWKHKIFNDFELALFPFYPQLKEIKEELYHQKAIYASLSGSGSALFGIFETQPALLNLREDNQVFNV